MESDTADNQSNNTNNKKNKPLRQTTITLKRKLANEDAKTTEPPSKRLKLSMEKRPLSLDKTNTISPSNKSNTIAPSSTIKPIKKSTKSPSNLAQLPALLIPNTFLNYNRYKSNVETATRRAKQLNTKRASVSIGLDLRSYTSQDAGMTQIVNLMKRTSIKYKKRNQKGNWEKNLGLKSYLHKYIEIHGDKKLVKLFKQGINGTEFAKFETALKKKNFEKSIETFIFQAMSSLFKKMIKKYKLSDVCCEIQKEYITKYGDNNDNNNNNNNNNNNKNGSSDLELYWPEYVNKQTYDKNKASYLKRAYAQLDAQQEKENDSDMIEIDLEILISPEPNENNDVV